MPSLPAARISHFTPRRLRIRVPEKRRDRAFFDAVAERLAAWDTIEAVETNPLTASILIHFSDPERLFLETAAKNDLFDIDFDAAVLDCNLNGKSVVPVAEAMAAVGKPFIFATGYGDNQSAPQGFSAPVIRKPYDVTQVAAALAEATGRI